MRPFTICYGLMFLALGAVTCYGIANVDDLRDPFHDMRTFTLPPKGETQSLTLRAPETASSAEKADTCCAAVVAPAQTAASTEAAATDAELTVVAGMTSDEVRALLGEPEDVSSDGARWTYGSSVLIFSDDRLSGHVAYDPLQAAMNRYDNMMASLGSATMAETSRSSSGPKVLRANIAPLARDRAVPYRQAAAGSARDGYRYNSNQQEYSYYMNRVGPMDRLYSGKRFLPRGMTSSVDRSSGAYFNSRTPRYGINVASQQYRR